jgi:glycosyltransferase involved in cell wall biosynthesis
MNRSDCKANNRPLTIVMIDSHATVERGGAVQCASLARALALRGHKVLCLFDGDPDQPLREAWFERLQNAGVRVRRLGLRRFGGLRQLRRLLAVEQPDILHTHKNRALFSAWLATVGKRRPIWLANRGTVYPLSRSLPAHWVHRRYVARILAVSNAVRDALLADGIPAEKVEVVYGSFDPERFHPEVSGAAMRRLWGVPPEAPLVGLVGSLKTPKKGHTVLLEAAALLGGKIPDLRFVLVGDGDPGLLQSRAASLGVSGRVIFPGFTDDVPAALAAMDIVVCASLRGEGLTGALREALAMARPVISSDVAGNRELVIDNQTGLLVTPGDPAALAEAIARMLGDGDLARSCALRGRAHVLTLCTEEIRATRIERIYRELLQHRQPGPCRLEKE